MALLIAGVAVSCNEQAEDQHKDETVVTTTVHKPGEGKKVVVAKADVPEPVVVEFEKKYPKTSNLTWTSYEPVEEDNWDMAERYYYADYIMDDVHYYTWYKADGTVVKNDVFVKGGEKLPAAINNAIASNYPGFEVVEVDKENDKDMDMYEIEMEKGDQKVKIKYLPDGTVFKVKEKD